MATLFLENKMQAVNQAANQVINAGRKPKLQKLGNKKLRLLGVLKVERDTRLELATFTLAR